MHHVKIQASKPLTLLSKLSHLVDTIIEVFSSLDSRGDGVISLDDVSRLFQGIDHPLVSQKGQRESDAVEHILGYFRNVAGAKTRSPRL